MLRDESWRAFSESGEITCIKDDQIMYYIARTYSSIRTLRNYAEYYYYETTVIETELNKAMDYAEEMITITFNEILDELGQRNIYLEKKADFNEKEEGDKVEEVDN